MPRSLLLALLFCLPLAFPVRPAMANTRQIPVSLCENGSPEIPLPAYGVALSFLGLNERIHSIRIGDPSRVVADTDVAVNGRAGQGVGAGVVFVRQLSNPVAVETRLLPSAKKSNTVPLTVMTFKSDGQRRLCQFTLRLNQSTAITRINVMPAIQPPNLVRPQIPASRPLPVPIPPTPTTTSEE